MKKIAFFLLGLLGILIVGGIAVGGFTYTQMQPVSSGSVETIRFSIPKGQAIGIIGDRLQEEGLIHNSLVFKVIVKKDGLAGKIQAGSFELSPGMSSSEIAEALTKGTTDLWITIPEGWRREEIAESLAAQELEVFDIEEFMDLTEGLEGQLFPETYLVPRLMETDALVNLLTNTFDERVLTELADDFEASEQDPNEILVMASIVEREARGYEQMRQVAGILWNRIENDMPLQADATLQYIRGFDENQQSWWTPPSVSYKEYESPYNTYLNQGLPPAPICNPGFEAVKATLNPADSDYIYYIHDNQGKIHFAETLDQHNENVNTYLR